MVPSDEEAPTNAPDHILTGYATDWKATMPNRFALTAVVALTVAACGGGGSGSGPQTMIQPPPRMDPPTRPQGDPVHYGTETDGPTAAEVLDYIGVFASGGPYPSANRIEYSQEPGISIFSKPATVRIAEGTDDHQRALIHHAVAMVNRATSYDRHITIGPDAPALTLWADVPDGQIFVDFAPHEDWKTRDPNLDVTAFAGLARHSYFVTAGKRSGAGLMKARIYMRDDLSPSNRSTMFTMVHELLHALGLGGHVDFDKYPDSFLGVGIPRAKRNVTQLGPIDTAAIAASEKIVRSVNRAAVQPEDLTLENLGPWETDAVTLSDTLGGMSWGVRHRNGISVPWTNGGDPATTLADNRVLRGTATWNGELLGFTPELNPVAGKAGIGVDLATMDGSADFTELQSWAAGSGPGALGTGVQWNTGSLGYTITVGGNYLRSTGGDDGTVNGRFYGSRHEGVSGTLERSDLTAAFGAAR